MRQALIYSGLSQALAAETIWPVWLTAPGHEWPLWLPVTQLAAESQWPELSSVVTCLAQVPASSRRRRQSAFERLTAGNGHGPIPFYESLYLNGRLLGPQTQAVGALYRQAGLEIDGAELPDHAAVELEFLAYLAEQESRDSVNKRAWRSIRRQFIRQHAGRWLPDIGARLSNSSDPAWSVIGQLLSLCLLQRRNQAKNGSKGLGLPEVINPDKCSLCGFCAQVCPTRAMWVGESGELTSLWLAPDRCVHCHQCERVCETQILKLTSSVLSPNAEIPLRQSQRATCPGCNTPTVSQAELEAVVARLGHHPRWLDYCLDCRAMAF